MVTEPALRAAIDVLLGGYGLRRLGPSRAVAGGSVNENFRVETADGPRFLRLHAQPATAASIALEHRAIAWADTHGLPVNPPCRAADGTTARQIDGCWWSLYPWLDGAHVELDQLDARLAATLGATHGLLHATLRDFDDPAFVGVLWPRWQTAATLADIDAIEAAARVDPWLGAERSDVLEALALRRALLLRDGRPFGEFAGLPMQTVHGDFHERNVLLDTRGGVQAVVDWEMVRRSPQIYDLLRALTFTHLLDSPLLTDYLAGYSGYATIDAAQCEAGVALWWQLRLHSTWVQHTRFIDRDLRTHRFLANEAEFLRRFAEPSARAALVQRLQDAFS